MPGVGSRASLYKTADGQLAFCNWVMAEAVQKGRRNGTILDLKLNGAFTPKLPERARTLARCKATPQVDETNLHPPTKSGGYGGINLKHQHDAQAQKNNKPGL